MKPTPHLTRAVFRALIANRPYIHHQCLRRPVLSTRCQATQRYALQQHRTFLDALFGDQTPKVLVGEKPTAKNVDVAIGKLVDLLRARRSRSRTPPNDQLADALRFIFHARFDEKRPMTRNEIFLVTETYKHLDERDLIISDHPGSLGEADLLHILNTLALPTPKERFRSDVRSLAERIVASLQKSHPSAKLPEEFKHPYLNILATTGSAIEARTEVLGSESPLLDQSLMLNILNGLLSEKRDSDFWSLLQTWVDKIGGMTASIQEHLVITFVGLGKLFDAQKIFGMTLQGGETPTTPCLRAMLQLTVKSGQMHAADGIARELSARIDEPNVVSSMILYYAARDKHHEELREHVHQLLQSSRADVTMDTLNDVIQYALKQNNPSLARAIEKIALDQGFVPNGKTVAIQLQSALDQCDFSEARKVYSKMLTQDIPDDDSDIPVLNRYLVALCSESDPPYELIMRITDSIVVRGADLEARAIAGLCHMFLYRGEIDELVGLLRYRIDFLPIPERAHISAVIREYIVNPEVKVQRAYNAYELYRVAFAETSCKDRLPLMQSFFDRKRPDLACQVFSHMRQSDPEDDSRPDAVAYTKCFEGIAASRDVDGLQAVYNMLKLDLQVNLTTQIRNSLMLANIACQTPWVAIIDHFYKIMDSKEGPSYSTFEVALRACETWPPYGTFEARKIIAVMQSWNLELTKSIYDNYIGVIAGQCEFENAVELIDNMETDLGEPPDAITIGTFYNAIPWQYRKDEVEKWAKQAYPELWTQLVSYGDEIDEDWDVRYFKIDRSIDIDDPPLFAPGEWKPELQRQAQSKIEPLPMAT